MEEKCADLAIPDFSKVINVTVYQARSSSLRRRFIFRQGKSIYRFARTYLTFFSEVVRFVLATGITRLVDRAMRKEDSSAQGKMIAEILQHLHACRNSVQVGTGTPCRWVQELRAGGCRNSVQVGAGAPCRWVQELSAGGCGLQQLRIPLSRALDTIRCKILMKNGNDMSKINTFDFFSKVAFPIDRKMFKGTRKV